MATGISKTFPDKKYCVVLSIFSLITLLTHSHFLSMCQVVSESFLRETCQYIFISAVCSEAFYRGESFTTSFR